MIYQWELVASGSWKWKKTTSSEVKASKKKRSTVNLSLSLFFVCSVFWLVSSYSYIIIHTTVFLKKKHSEASWFDRNCEMIGDVTPSYMHLISIKSSYQKLLDCLRLRRMVCVLWCFFFRVIASYAKRPFSCCLGQGLRGLASKILPKVNTEKTDPAQDASLCHLDGWMDGNLVG